jgi:hypothetical protein
MAKRRVSAKQRLELVQEAFIKLRDTYGHAEIEDFQYFADAVETALFSALEPRPRADDAPPF